MCKVMRFTLNPRPPTKKNAARQTELPYRVEVALSRIATYVVGTCSSTISDSMGTGEAASCGTTVSIGTVVSHELQLFVGQTVVGTK